MELKVQASEMACAQKDYDDTHILQLRGPVAYIVDRFVGDLARARAHAHTHTHSKSPVVETCSSASDAIQRLAWLFPRRLWQ
jgi:hypothetical protein